MKPLRVGVVGIGDISDVYIQNLKKYDVVRVTACSARSAEKAKAKARQHSIDKPYADSRALIEDPEIDVILNLTPPAVHAEYNLLALNAGKHVYTEKPLAVELDEAREIMATARRKNLCVGCAPDTFLGGRLQTCRRLLDDGTIGDVVGAGAWVVSHGHEWHHPNPDFFYQRGGGPLLDIGPYYITALLSLLGPVRECSAMSRRTHDSREVMFGPRKGDSIQVEVDTHIAGTIQFHSGAIASIVTSFDVWDSELPRIEIYGTKATLCIPDVDPLDGPNLFGGPVLLMRAERCRWRGLPRPDALPEWEEVPVRHRFNETSHRANSRGIGLVDMAYAIRDGREPRAGGEMALHSVETMSALLESARDHRFVTVTGSFRRPEPLPENFPESEG